MRPAKNKPQPHRRLPSGTRLFLFTEEEENRIADAIELSIRFMRSYGKGRMPFGRSPVNQPSINKPKHLKK